MRARAPEFVLSRSPIESSPGGENGSSLRLGTRSLPNPDALLLAHRPRPFSLDRELLELPAGLTIAEIVHIAQPDPVWREYAVVRLGDDPEPLDRRYWHRIKPRAGQRIVLTIVPGDGNTLKMALIIAVVAVALIAAPYLTPAFMGAGGVTAVGAALSIGGMLAVNALIPPTQPKVAGGDTSPTSYSLTGGSNRARLWQPIPRVLGRHRMAPDLAAPWVTDVEGDKAYLCGLLSFGYGPLEVSDIRIGETPLTSYDGVQTQFVAGWPDEVADFSLYPNVIVPLAVSTRLSKSIGWVSRTTSPDTDLAVVELALPSGGFRAGSDPGERVGIAVNFEIDIQPVGGTRTRWGNHRIDAKTTTTKRSTIRIPFVGRGQYAIFIRRTTDDADPDDERQRIDESWWIALRSHRNEVPIKKTGLCLLAIRIKATEQLNNTIDNLTGIAHSIGWEWNYESNNWDMRPMNKPHGLFRLILQGNGQRQPVDDANIDFPTLEAWGAYCWEKGLTCNTVLDQGISTWEALRLVCAAGRAAPTCSTGVWSVVVDWPRPFAVQQFTPRNSTNFKGRRLFVDMPHALRCRFIDEADYEERERVVYDDGRDAGNSSKFESVEFPGVTDPEQIYRLARMRIAEARLRSPSFEVETSWDWLSATRGDRVALANDVMEWGADSFRIKELSTMGSLLIGIILDGQTALASGISYDIAIRGTDQRFIYAVNASAGLSNRLDLQEPVTLPTGLAVGDLVTVGARGVVNYDCIIQSITPGRDMSAKLSLIPYNEGVYSADTELIPAWDAGRTPSAGVDQPLILGVRSGETAGKRNSDGSLFVRVIVSLYDEGSRPLTALSGIDLRWREKDSEGPWLYMSFPADARELTIIEAEDNTTIEFSVRYVRRDGRQTLWTAMLDHFVDGPDIPPPDVPSIYVDGDRLSWTPPSPMPPDLAGYKLWWNTTEGQPLNAALPFSEGIQTDTWIPLGAVPDSAAEMLVVAITTAGLQSVNPARAKITPGLLPQNVEITRTDYRTLGWPGDKTNCQIDGITGDLIATDTSLFLNPTTARFLDPASGGFLAANWNALFYEFTFTIPSLAREGDRVRLDMIYEGAIQLFYAWGGDAFETWPPEVPITEPLWTYANNNPSLPLGVFMGSLISLPGVFEEDVFEEDVFELQTLGIGASQRGLRPWRTAINIKPGEALRIQLRGPGGSGVQPRVTRLVLVLEGPEIEQQFANFLCAAGGSRLPVNVRFRKIEWVYGIPRADASSQGMSPGFVTKDLPEGPIVIVRDQAGHPIEAMSDWRIGGV